MVGWLQFLLHAGTGAKKGSCRYFFLTFKPLPALSSTHQRARRRGLCYSGKLCAILARCSPFCWSRWLDQSQVPVPVPVTMRRWHCFRRLTTDTSRPSSSAEGLSCRHCCHRQGKAPVMAAASNGHVDVLQLLLEKTGINAALVVADSHGDTALLLAASGGHAPRLGHPELNRCGARAETCPSGRGGAHSLLIGR